MSRTKGENQKGVDGIGRTNGSKGQNALELYKVNSTAGNGEPCKI